MNAWDQSWNFMFALKLLFFSENLQHLFLFWVIVQKPENQISQEKPQQWISSCVPRDPLGGGMKVENLQPSHYASTFTNDADAN